MKATIKIKGKVFEVYDFVGRVVERKTWSETHVYGGGGYVGPNGGGIAPVYSDVYTNNELFLVNENGVEESFSFSNIPIPAIRSGHRVQVIWVASSKKAVGSYVLVRNVSLNTESLNTREVYWIVRSNPWFIRLAFIVVVIPLVIITLGFFTISLANGLLSTIFTVFIYHIIKEIRYIKLNHRANTLIQAILDYRLTSTEHPRI